MKISGVVGMSHSPSWDLSRIEGSGSLYVNSVLSLRDQIAEISPDAIVVFGPDHVRNFFFDSMPAFCVGVETVTGFGDYDSPKGRLPAKPALAQHIVAAVMEDGFDPAVSFSMGIDHGITQPYAALDETLAIPIVPIMVNCAGPPLPSIRRCHEFGVAVGNAIRGFADDGNVIVVGSGGMSHSPPSISPLDKDLDPDTRDYVINGRERAAQFNASREAMSKTRRAKGGTGPINEVWDAWFLECLRTGRLEPILGLSSDELRAHAGVGGQELRSWVAALGAWSSGPVENITYEPVPGWITGMGCISSFV